LIFSRLARARDDAACLRLLTAQLMPLILDAAPVWSYAVGNHRQALLANVMGALCERSLQKNKKKSRLCLIGARGAEHRINEACNIRRRRAFERSTQICILVCFGLDSAKITL
jgi:hypothetical protein